MVQLDLEIKLEYERIGRIFGLGYLFSLEDKYSLKFVLLNAVKNYDRDIAKLSGVSKKLKDVSLKYYTQEIIEIHSRLKNGANGGLL